MKGQFAEHLMNAGFVSSRDPKDRKSNVNSGERTFLDAIKLSENVSPGKTLMPGCGAVIEYYMWQVNAAALVCSFSTSHFSPQTMRN